MCWEDWIRLSVLHSESKYGRPCRTTTFALQLPDYRVAWPVLGVREKAASPLIPAEAPSWMSARMDPLYPTRLRLPNTGVENTGCATVGGLGSMLSMRARWCQSLTCFGARWSVTLSLAVPPLFSLPRPPVRHPLGYVRSPSTAGFGRGSANREAAHTAHHARRGDVGDPCQSSRCANPSCLNFSDHHARAKYGRKPPRSRREVTLDPIPTSRTSVHLKSRAHSGHVRKKKNKNSSGE